MGGSPKKCVYPHQSGETQVGRRVPAEGERNGGCGAAARQRGSLRCLSAANRRGAGTMCAGWRGACLRRRGALAAPCNAGKTHANPQLYSEARTATPADGGKDTAAPGARSSRASHCRPGTATLRTRTDAQRPPSRTASAALGWASTTARFYAAPGRTDPWRFVSALLSSVAWLAFAQPRRCVSASLLCSLL